MYSITVDHGRRIVCAKLSGFFSEEEVAAFARDEQAAAASLGCKSGEFGLLLQTPGGILQSQDVVTAFQRLLTDLPLKAGRVAIVSESALLKMQLRRIMATDRSGVFDTVVEALAWIGEGLNPTARRPSASRNAR